jgi:hypothetical protein
VRRTSWLVPAASLAILFVLAGEGRAERKPKPPTTHPGPPQASESVESDEPTFAIAGAVVCADIRGFEDFRPLPDAALTSEEKLLVYYRPLNYRTDHNGSTYHIHLVQDGQIRRRGENSVLNSKSGMLDYDWKSKEPDKPVYMRNTYSLKGLQPGEYDFDIILHDRLAPGEPTTRHTLPFRVVPAGTRSGQDEAKK